MSISSPNMIVRPARRSLHNTERIGVTPKERSGETGISKSSLYAKANLFDQAGMASSLSPVHPPEIPKQDKRTLA
jgi:hypothetical protein